MQALLEITKRNISSQQQLGLKAIFEPDPLPETTTSPKWLIKQSLRTTKSLIALFQLQKGHFNIPWNDFPWLEKRLFNND